MANAIKEYFGGSCDADFQNHLIGQVIRSFEGATSIKGVGSQEKLVSSLNIAIAILHGIKPRDEIETMLMVQMISVHNLIMQQFSGAMMEGQSIDGVERCVSQATKMLRTFTTQMEALKKYRTGGQQKVTVEHVNVNEGGQAIVGNVGQGGGGSNEKNQG
ncbi:MAG: hypothetical protein U5R49_12150 [Deltaproteobacteria bacterium]|nr:hypothetical protein [Deltaproteobacteria bacterium]